MDFEYKGPCPNTGKLIVKEQLYPESRGWIEHPFDKIQDVKDFLISKGSTLQIE